MRLDCAGRDEQACGDIGVAEAGIDEPEDLCLADGDAESGEVRRNLTAIPGELGADGAEDVPGPTS